MNNITSNGVVTENVVKSYHCRVKLAREAALAGAKRVDYVTARGNIFSNPKCLPPSTLIGSIGRLAIFRLLMPVGVIRVFANR